MQRSNDGDKITSCNERKKTISKFKIETVIFSINNCWMTFRARIPKTVCFVLVYSCSVTTRDINKATGSKAKAKACQLNPRPGQGQIRPQLDQANNFSVKHKKSYAKVIQIRENIIYINIS